MTFGRKLTLALLAITPALIAASPTPASADDLRRWYRWSPTDYTLEVAQQSTADGAVVGMYPYNGGTHQFWWSQFIINRPAGNYYRLYNHNSGKSLDAYADCTIHQYGTTNKTNRQWRASVNVAYADNPGYHLINYAGCDSGLAYKDVLMHAIGTYSTRLAGATVLCASFQDVDCWVKTTKY